MKSYKGKVGDCCFFYRCKYCKLPFLIQEEMVLHQTRCEAVQGARGNRGIALLSGDVEE